MSQIAVVYWSGTGQYPGHGRGGCQGVRRAALFTADGILRRSGRSCLMQSPSAAPPMGAEVLEESEFQPMFDACKPKLQGKKIALFGSYGWGDGEWMRSWEEDCIAAGATLACGSVICQDDPDDSALAECEALGKALQ